MAAWVLRTGEKKYGLKLFEGSLKTVKFWQWALVAAGAALKIYASVMDWGGFKVYLEWKSHGTLLFIFQYIYYMFETLLFTLILVFAQLAFETWFKNRTIPYGGIVMGLTWGLGHIFTKGSLLIGLEGVAIGLLFGSLLQSVPCSGSRRPVSVPLCPPHGTGKCKITTGIQEENLVKFL